MRFFRNRREFCAAMVPVLLAMGLGGCASEAVDEENVILVEREEAPVNYSLTVASLGDVVKTQKVKCVYEQTNEEDISFAVSGSMMMTVMMLKMVWNIASWISGVGNAPENIDA